MLGVKKNQTENREARIGDVIGYRTTSGSYFFQVISTTPKKYKVKVLEKHEDYTDDSQDPEYKQWVIYHYKHIKNNFQSDKILLKNKSDFENVFIGNEFYSSYEPSRD